MTVPLPLVEFRDHFFDGSTREAHHARYVCNIHPFLMAEVHQHIAGINHILIFILRKDLFFGYFGLKWQRIRVFLQKALIYAYVSPIIIVYLLYPCIKSSTPNEGIVLGIGVETLMYTGVYAIMSGTFLCPSLKALHHMNRRAIVNIFLRNTNTTTPRRTQKPRIFVCCHHVSRRSTSTIFVSVLSL